MLLVEHIIEIESKSAMTSLHSSVMEETGRLGVDIFIDNGGILIILQNNNGEQARVGTVPSTCWHSAVDTLNVVIR